MHLSSLFSCFCQVLAANTAELLEPYLLTLRCCGNKRRTARSPWLTAPDIFALLVHIHTGVLLAATHQMKSVSFGEMVPRQETR